MARRHGRRRAGVLSGSILVAVLLLGACGGVETRSTLSDDPVVSRTVPPMRQGTSPTRWEFLCLQRPNLDQLAEAGEQGWDIVAIAKGPRKSANFASAVMVCFHRELPPKSDDAAGGS